MTRVPPQTASAIRVSPPAGDAEHARGNIASPAGTEGYQAGFTGINEGPKQSTGSISRRRRPATFFHLIRAFCYCTVWIVVLDANRLIIPGNLCSKVFECRLWRR